MLFLPTGIHCPSGSLQRVAIARALIRHPAALIADNPVSMVDSSLRISIVNLLRDLRDNFGWPSSTSPMVSPPPTTSPTAS